MRTKDEISHKFNINKFTMCVCVLFIRQKNMSRTTEHSHENYQRILLGIISIRSDINPNHRTFSYPFDFSSSEFFTITNRHTSSVDVKDFVLGGVKIAISKILTTKQDAIVAQFYVAISRFNTTITAKRAAAGDKTITMSALLVKFFSNGFENQR